MVEGCIGNAVNAHAHILLGFFSIIVLRKDLLLSIDFLWSPNPIVVIYVVLGFPLVACGIFWSELDFDSGKTLAQRLKGNKDAEEKIMHTDKSK